MRGFSSAAIGWPTREPFNGGVLIPETSTRVAKVCSVCGAKFIQGQRYDRFSDSCRIEDEMYQHSDWTVYY